MKLDGLEDFIWSEYEKVVYGEGRDGERVDLFGMGDMVDWIYVGVLEYDR